MFSYNNKNKAGVTLVNNLYISAFLYSRGLRLIDIYRTDPRRAQFVFQDNGEFTGEKLIHFYNYSLKNEPEMMVDAREFVTAIKALKDRLYQEGV